MTTQTIATTAVHTSFWTLDRVADALAAHTQAAPPRGNQPLRAMTTDTRTVQPGDCFVALKGERYDAHDFLVQAVDAGASALVVSRPPKIGTFSIPVYVVHDTLVALGALAYYWRMAWNKPVIGIAGSNGKTSTKELVRAALGRTYHVHATTGNLNNRVGVPLTLLAIPGDADVAVIELGTSLPGEIAMLRDIARPNVAVITSVAEEHLEGLGDLAGVLREEVSVANGVPVVITPATQPEIADAATLYATQIIRAGLESGDVHADAWSIDRDGLGVITFQGVTIRPPVRGLHNLQNTMLALATARACGVSIDTAAEGIAAMPVPSMRTHWTQLGRATVINDAYNANPGSARAAIALLAATTGAQRVAILGTMRELGSNAAGYHDDVARAAVASPADIIAGIGDFRDALARVAPDDPRVVTASDVDDLWPLLAPRLHPEATILLKASRGVRLERILPHLTTWATSC